jgi:CBS domain-containing protein
VRKGNQQRIEVIRAMQSRIQDIMTPAPMTLPATASLRAAAETMRDAKIGDVLVVDEADRLLGIVTDRDLVVRGIAAGADLDRTAVGEVASPAPVTVQPGDDPRKAVDLMRENGIRRIPVVNGDDPIGIVSLGDLAVERDSTSALADISAQPPNA